MTRYEFIYCYHRWTQIESFYSLNLCYSVTLRTVLRITITECLSLTNFDYQTALLNDTVLNTVSGRHENAACKIASRSSNQCVASGVPDVNISFLICANVLCFACNSSATPNLTFPPPEFLYTNRVKSGPSRAAYRSANVS